MTDIPGDTDLKTQSTWWPGAKIILWLPSPPFAEHVLFKDVALNDNFPPLQMLSPVPLNWGFQTKAHVPPPPTPSSSKIIQTNTPDMKLLSDALFKVATNLEILHNKGSRGSNRGQVATINVTKIVINLSWIFK